MSKKKTKQLDPNIMNAPEETTSTDLTEGAVEEEVEDAVENEEVTSEEAKKDSVEEPEDAEDDAVEDTTSEVPDPLEETKEEVTEENHVEEPTVEEPTPVPEKVEEPDTEENEFSFILAIEGNGKDLNAIVEKIKANRKAKDFDPVVDEDMNRVVVFKTNNQKIAIRRQKELIGYGIKAKMIIHYLK